MKRLTRDHTVPPDKRYKVLKPAITIDLGEELTVETINEPVPVIRDESDVHTANSKGREETGPVYFNGIKTGDMLGIKILDIREEGHACGSVYDETGANAFLRIHDSKVHFPGGLWVNKRMMIGDIYVTPPLVDGNPWTYIKGNPSFNGGNMDFRDICTGNTICFPVFCDGALLVLGDLHAYQGDGEIAGVGAECAGEVDIAGYKEDVFISKNPVIIKSDSFVALSMDIDYTEAKDAAAHDAALIVQRISGATYAESLHYCKVSGSLRNGAIWSMGKLTPWGKLPQVVGLEVPVPFYDINTRTCTL